MKSVCVLLLIAVALFAAVPPCLAQVSPISTRNKGGMKLGKKVEASGEKFVGYGGQLFDKETLLAEYFSEPSFKPLVAPKK